ncbi:putative lipoyltransferase 2, mitochondrial [Lingula anatina]|uniref:Octanoyl-[acyl-carrier-protein]:protein N-octanoyltransferase LIPT2, mitochondrial n=1 Tax=Lingula anatina TaxID=7574 RepID=A0A2R2MNR5_LINAN|nr:putative lipoyltransferase 2, mitochondrial [Lingula anatina]|eukprot:XP_023931854.1 putative lipoyltransferase 2, mitochondrial [Lingula anatina]
MQQQCVFMKLGRLGYLQALEIQNRLSKLRLDHMAGEPVQQNPVNTLLLLEHNPVYTIGMRTKDYTLRDEDHLKALGAEFVKTNRGGLITFHGPGQLVVYPVIYLKDFKLSMREYIRKLEDTVIDMCAVAYGIEANTTKDTGIWVGEKKLCAIGVHGARYVTTHGLALNCNTDLDWFKHIVPCGIVDKGVTSLSQLMSRNVTVEEAIPPFLQSFAKNFQCELKEMIFTSEQ